MRSNPPHPNDIPCRVVHWHARLGFLVHGRPDASRQSGWLGGRLAVQMVSQREECSSYIGCPKEKSARANQNSNDASPLGLFPHVESGATQTHKWLWRSFMLNFPVPRPNLARAQSPPEAPDPPHPVRIASLSTLVSRQGACHSPEEEGWSDQPWDNWLYTGKIKRLQMPNKLACNASRNSNRNLQSAHQVLVRLLG